MLQLVHTNKYIEKSQKHLPLLFPRNSEAYHLFFYAKKDLYHRNSGV